MKKWRYIFICICLFLLCFSFASCGKKETIKKVLETPKNLKIDDSILSWEGVENADGYRITVNGEAFDEKKGRSCDLSSLTEDGVYELGVQAFDEDKIYEDSLIATVEYKIVKGALNPQLEYTLINYNGTIGYEVKGSIYLQGEVEIPDYYNSKPVISIAEQAFSIALNNDEIDLNSNCNTLTTGVKLPAYLKRIGKFAFANCVSIEKMVLPDGVEEVGMRAFGGMLALKEIVIPASLKEIPMKFCSMCKSLEKIDIPNGVEIISVQAFQGTENLTELLISEGVKIIRSKAFEGATSLTKVVIPKSVEEIGALVFANCSQLVEITMEGKPKKIDGGIFDSTAWLENYPSPFVTVFGDVLYCYRDDETVETIEEKDFPEHIRYMLGGAFQDCRYVKSISIPNEIVIEATQSLFDGCTQLQYVKLPTSITKLEYGMFNDCRHLDTIVIPGIITMARDSWLSVPVENVYYGGGEDGWKKLMEKCDLSSLYLEHAAIHFYGEETDETLAAGEYWCFDENGEIKVWKKEEDNPEAAIA